MDKNVHLRNGPKWTSHGITLIALIITIIILLILAGITIGAVTGDNNLINQAEGAKEKAEIDGEKELIGTAVIEAMGKDKQGDITVEGLQKELEDEALVEKIRRKIVITINNSQRKYYIDDNGNVFEYEDIELAQMESGGSFYERMKDYRTKILTVKVLDNMEIPENAYIVFDVSQEQDETVKAWLIENEENSEMYDLYIGGNGGVEITSCTKMFQDYTNCTSIDLEYLYTENAKTFDNMFYNDGNLLEINAPYLVNDKAEILTYMFYLCTKLKSIDTSNWDTSNVTSMFGTFRMCQNIGSLDLSNWDTSKVKKMDYLFQYCQKLKTIYVSDKWNNDNVTSSEAMFQGCQALKGKINFDANKTDVTYANYNTGYFTYKANE